MGKLENPNFRLNNFIDIKNATISVMKLALSNQIGTKKADMLIRALNSASNNLKLHYEKEKIVEMNEQINKLLQASNIDMPDESDESETMKHNEKMIELYNIEEPEDEEPEELEESELEEIEQNFLDNMDLI